MVKGVSCVFLKIMFSFDDFLGSIVGQVALIYNY